MRLPLAAALLSIWLPATAAAQPAPPSSVSPELAATYVRPQQLVELNGRKINLVCMGSGPHTVLLESGGSDWSDTWALVQPQVAKQARVCAYDRAGLGHSDPARGMRTPVAVVEDLHQLIVTAKLQTPLVLVGHSLGGFNAKLYAALYPSDVAGLVLVDPAEDRTPARSRALLRRQFGEALAARSELLDRAYYLWLADRYRSCAEAAAAAPLDPDALTYRRCTDPVRPQLGPQIAAERRRVQVTAAYQGAQASEIINSVYGDDTTDAVYANLFRPGVFGRKPVVVLTHGAYDKDDPLDVASQAAGIALHEETSRLSKVGRHRVVSEVGHNIQLEAPGAIVAAIGEVLADLDGQAPQSH